MTPIRITPAAIAVTAKPNDAHTTPPLPDAHAAARVHATARGRNRGAARMEGH